MKTHVSCFSFYFICENEICSPSKQGYWICIEHTVFKVLWKTNNADIEPEVNDILNSIYLWSMLTNPNLFFSLPYLGNLHFSQLFLYPFQKFRSMCLHYWPGVLVPRIWCLHRSVRRSHTLEATVQLPSTYSDYQEMASSYFLAPANQNDNSSYLPKWQFLAYLGTALGWFSWEQTPQYELETWKLNYNSGLSEYIINVCSSSRRQPIENF
jgi:hypothetical protein